MMRHLFTLLILLLPFQAGAQDDALLGVRLDWNRYDTTLAIGDTTHETRINHVAVILNEPSWRRLYGGLRLGYVDISQSDNPAVTGLDMHGNSLGLRLGAYLIHNDHLNVFVQGDYDYLQANDEQDDQKAEFDWTETTLQVGATLKLGVFRLAGAGYRYSIDGEQKLRGPVNATTRFNEAERTGTIVGIEFQVDPTGYIGIHTENGAREGTRLTFIREF